MSLHGDHTPSILMLDIDILSVKIEALQTLSILLVELLPLYFSALSLSKSRFHWLPRQFWRAYLVYLELVYKVAIVQPRRDEILYE